MRLPKFRLPRGTDVERIQQHGKWQNAQPLGFLSRGNHRDPAESAGSVHGGIGIGGHADIALQSHGAHARCQFARHRRGWSIEPLQSIEIEQQTVGMRVLHARSKGMSDIEQRGV